MVTEVGKLRSRAHAYKNVYKSPKPQISKNEEDLYAESMDVLGLSYDELQTLMNPQQTPGNIYIYIFIRLS